jgi:hypothetical protein
MAEDGDSLLREVQEELRREQLRKIWDNYNGLIIGGAVFLLLAVGGYQILESRRIAAEQTAGAEFSAAENLSEQKKEDEAKKIFTKLAETGPAGYGAIAKLRLAGEQVKAGKIADAVATYDSLAEQSGADELLKSFAQLQAASLRLPDADYSEIQNRLTPLAGDDAPYFKSARELLGLAAYRAKKYDEARKYLEPLLIDPNASEAMQNRIKVVMAGIASAEVGSATPETAAPTTTTEGAAKSEPAKTEAKPEGAAGPDKKQ